MKYFSEVVSFLKFFVEKEYKLEVPPKARIQDIPVSIQQRVEILKALYLGAELLIMDEPTRGIDVGAKAEIEKLIQQLAREGISVLYISSEIEELVRGCDRIAVLREGSVFGELFGEEITSDNLLHMIAGEDTAKTGGE